MKSSKTSRISDVLLYYIIYQQTRERTILAWLFTLISLQTQDDSMVGAIEYIKTLVKLKIKYGLSIEVLGALPMLSNSRGTVDKLIIESAKKEWGDDLVFETVIPQMERIKRFSINGITDEDRFDRKVLEMYEKVVSEMLSKLLEFEE